jgi:DNA-directed RNA polymerase specialized sigma24 family protein
VGSLLEEWKWRDSMHSPAEKQRFLEPLIQRVKSNPKASEGPLIFLLLVCEGVRRGVARELLAVRGGLEGPSAAPAFHRREETRRIRDIERERLLDVGWRRETIAHRTLDFVSGELSELSTSSLAGTDAEAMQAYLSGLEAAVPPALADDHGLARWRRRIAVRPLYEAVGDFWRLDGVRDACRTAVDRLPRRQRSVIEAHFYEGALPEDIAAEHGVTRSTIYNTKAQALVALHGDDCFFAALCGLRVVRDKVRERELHDRYPQGRLPDGRRIVWIDQAA